MREYFLFDPLGEYLRPRLQEFHLGPSGYLPVIGESMGSELLGLALEPEGWMLRLRELRTRKREDAPCEAERALRQEREPGPRPGS